MNPSMLTVDATSPAKPNPRASRLCLLQESLLLVTGPYLYTYAPKRLTYIPKEMDVYYGTELSAVVHTN